MVANAQQIVWFEEIRRHDVPRVGGKNASLGEMVGNLAAEGVKVPAGFATTADAYWRFIESNGLRVVISSTLADLEARRVTLAEAGSTLRSAFLHGDWSPEMATAITAAYRDLCKRTARRKRTSPCARARPLKTFPTRASPGNRKPILIFEENARCSTPAGAVTLRCSPTGRLAIGKPKGSII